MRSLQRIALLVIVAGSPALAQTAPAFDEQAIFVSGQGGYHTYRIPAIVRADDGALLAFCEGRKNSSSDRGDIDLVLKRSTDDGRTWGPMYVIQDDRGNTMGNPAPVVDRVTGTIWLPFTRNNDRVFVTSSRDQGKTWSARREITLWVKRQDWSWYATGPCHSIQLTRGTHKGRLVIPCDHVDLAGMRGSHVFYSDDHGQTWRLGGVVRGSKAVWPNECSATELRDGRIYLNMRNQATTTRRRYVAYSADGGDSFGPAAFDATLVDPRVQGSALRFAAKDSGGRYDRVLFSNPATTNSRRRLTVRSSFDETRSWTAQREIYAGPAAYSDLVVTQAGFMGLFYESGVSSPYERITFARFNEEWLDAPEQPASLIYDGFDYGVTGNNTGTLDGKAGGTGWSAAWSASGTTLRATSLASPGFPNAAFGTFGLAPAGNRISEGRGVDATRGLATRLDLSRDASYYLSCLLRREDHAGTDRFTLKLRAGTVTRAQFGWYEDTHWLAGGSTLRYTRTPMAAATTYFAVLRVEAAAATLDRVWLKVYGPNDRVHASEGKLAQEGPGPDEWTVIGYAFASNVQLDNVALDFAGTRSTVGVDELRIGPSWRAVTTPRGASRVLGRGCVGSGLEVATLSPIGAPTLGNHAFGFALARATQLTPAALLFGSRLTPLAFPSSDCTLYLDASLGLVLAGVSVSDASGLGRFGVPVPNEPKLIGARVPFQTAILDPLLGSGFTLTNAVELQL